MENLIFFIIFLKTTILQAKTLTGVYFNGKFYIFFVQAKSGDFSNFHIKLVFIEKLDPLYIGFRPEFSFKLK